MGKRVVMRATTGVGYLFDNYKQGEVPPGDTNIRPAWTEPFVYPLQSLTAFWTGLLPAPLCHLAWLRFCIASRVFYLPILCF